MPCSYPRGSVRSSRAAPVPCRGSSARRRGDPPALGWPQPGFQPFAREGAYFQACAQPPRPGLRSLTAPATCFEPVVGPAAHLSRAPTSRAPAPQAPTSRAPAPRAPTARAPAPRLPTARFLLPRARASRAPTARVPPQRLGSVRARLGPCARVPELPPAPLGKTHTGRSAHRVLICLHSAGVSSRSG